VTSFLEPSFGKQGAGVGEARVEWAEPPVECRGKAPVGGLGGQAEAFSALLVQLNWLTEPII